MCEKSVVQYRQSSLQQKKRGVNGFGPEIPLSARELADAKHHATIDGVTVNITPIAALDKPEIWR